VIEIVSATRGSKTSFWAKTALGASLKRLKRDTRLSSFIAFDNRRGLPDVYNDRIRTDKSPDILVFMHDDVWIDDYFIADRILEGLKTYDAIGVAGNRRRVPGQTLWSCIDDKFTRESPENLSGTVAHAKHPFGEVVRFGASPADCELLDGVLLAARKSTLNAHWVGFDPQFDFHFYDMDFCRSAREKGLRLGTWPICLTHQSTGAFGSPRWMEKRLLYGRKWAEG
jgi:GT2 family glycosyltransferase